MKKKRNLILLVLILLLGLLFRTYGAKALFLYSHDQDLAGWIIKDIVVNKHIRLIGQETSTAGVFIGPLFYYLLIPFYLLFNMDPIGGVVLVSLLGAFSIWSFYFVFSKTFNQKVGLIAAFLYAVSFYTIFNDREVVPTMPVIAWSVWFFYGINLLLKGKQKTGFITLGILAGLIWHLNMGLVLLLSLIPVAQFLSKKKFNLKAALFGVLALFITSVPLLAFEIRHGFSQTKAVYTSLTTPQHDIVSGVEKIRRVIHLASKNAAGFIWGSLPGISYEVILVLLLGIFMLLIARKVLSKNQAIIFSLWLLAYLVFFSAYSKILSEYYLNGMMVVWIAIVALGIAYLLGKKDFKKWGRFSLVVFFAIGFYRFITLDVNRSGYVERKALVRYIKEDARAHGYPCIAISYITKPGYDLGYRYFYWLEAMHVNRPESGSPVYSIVFPHKNVGRLDKSFGALGLVLPDYEKYKEKEVEISCSGANSNLTDSMFGYTE